MRITFILFLLLCPLWAHPEDVVEDANLSTTQKHKVGSPQETPVWEHYSWGKTSFTWSLLNDCENAPMWLARKKVKKTFSSWSHVTGLKFKEVGEGADIKISFVDQIVRGGELKLGCGYYPSSSDLGGDIIISNNYNWSMKPKKGPYLDLYKVLMHELGHSLGLLHSGDKSSLMYPSYQKRRPVLNASDKKAVQKLYGKFLKN